MSETIDHEVIHGSSMPPPIGHYSQAVRVGNLLFIAGQPGIDLSGSADPDTARAVPGGFEAEWRQAFRNLEAILDEAGSGLGHVVKTTTFLTDLYNGEAANRLYAEFFPTNPPARSSPVVVLPRGLLLSVEAIAVIP
jgi:2-iminobutanoate/2-iminopropanoate deaminase